VLVISVIPLAVATARPTVKLLVPPPGRYGIEDLWKATVHSDTECFAWFEGYVFEASHGQVFWAKTDSFLLKKNTTKVYGYHDVRVVKTQTAPGYEVFVTRSGTLPQGEYDFVLLLKPLGVGDTSHLAVRPMGRPRLIIPKDGDTTKTKSVRFIWTAPVPKPPGPVTYEFGLYRILPGQTALEAALSNPPWFEQKNIRTTSLTYPTSARPLPDTGQFVWRVTALPYGGQELVSAPASFQCARAAALPEIVVPLKVNVLKGIVGDKGFGKATVEKKVVAAVEEANADIFAQAGVKLDFSKDNINWDVEDPDNTNDTKMDRNYSNDDAKAVNGKANEELKKKFGEGKKVRGFKLYLTMELLNKGADENGVGYWFPPDTPGFSVLEMDGLMVGIKPSGLLAHEILHGLGCLEDTQEEGNAMNPGAGRGTKLTDEQIKQLRAAAAKRQ
jgi:hypothetical protein